MNDAATINAIGEVLENYYRGTLTPYEALNQIARLKGSNEIGPAQ